MARKAVLLKWGRSAVSFVQAIALLVVVQLCRSAYVCSFVSGFGKCPGQIRLMCSEREAKRFLATELAGLYRLYKKYDDV